MNSFPKGSEWRKWDLHLHTPSSYDYHDKSISSATIVDVLKANSIALVAVTDHHKMDVERIIELQTLAGNDIKFLPGVELRCELGGSESIHFIGIFPDQNDDDLSTLWIKLSGSLALTEKDIKTKSDAKIFCKLEEASKLIHDLGGLVSIHAGKKSNTLENITNALPYKQALKAEILDYIDIFEMGQVSDIADYKSHVLPNISKHPPMILCSDNHDIKNYSLKANCWIKADSTFLGLRQLLVEPQDRVYVGEIPHKIKRVNDPTATYVESIKIHSVKDDQGIGWFKANLSLNPGLIAIIGRKGSGKSALADILALLGQSHILPDHYSFLNKNKFRKKGLANAFEAEAVWMNGDRYTVNLGGEVDAKSAIERVKYLPQQYVETICNEAGISKLFQTEIDKLVFSYVDPKERLGTTKLGDLIGKMTQAVQDKETTIRSRIKKLINDFLSLEEKTDPYYLSSLKNKLIEKHNLLISMKDPEPVDKPTDQIDSETQKIIDGFVADIATLTKRIDADEEELTGINTMIVNLTNITQKLADLEDSVHRFKSDVRDSALELGIDVDKLVSITVDHKIIVATRSVFESRRQSLQTSLDLPFSDEPNSDRPPAEVKEPNLVRRRDARRAELGKIKHELTEKQKAYQEYLHTVAKLNERKAKLIGKSGDTSLETITSITEEMEYVSNDLITEKNELFQKILASTKELCNTITSKQQVYSTIYRPLQNFVEQQQTERDSKDSVLSFQAGLVCDRFLFSKTFLDFIDKSKIGSFRRIKESSDRLKSVLDRHNFDSAEATLAFLSEIMDCLTTDKSSQGITKLRISDQLVAGESKELEFYQFLFGLEYISVKYKILFNDKDVSSNLLSPGEMGAVLLIFYLLIDRSHCPLIIDQPEENLDNESVVSLLVPFIRRAKELRQVIIVTHNPNLAVVCDAEQIIHCEMKKEKELITYTSGSIESLDMNKHITDVLEGTMPAFRKRDAKYIKSLTAGGRDL